MSQTITVSDAAYANLLSQVQQQGLDSVETLIETTYAPATTISAEEWNAAGIRWPAPTLCANAFAPRAGSCPTAHRSYAKTENADRNG